MESKVVIGVEEGILNLTFTISPVDELGEALARIEDHRTWDRSTGGTHDLTTGVKSRGNDQGRGGKARGARGGRGGDGRGKRDIHPKVIKLIWNACVRGSVRPNRGGAGGAETYMAAPKSTVAPVPAREYDCVLTDANARTRKEAGKNTTRFWVHMAEVCSTITVNYCWVSQKTTISLF